NELAFCLWHRPIRLGVSGFVTAAFTTPKFPKLTKGEVNRCAFILFHRKAANLFTQQKKGRRISATAFII
ncbi:MAG: hypothetical protein ABJ015_19185, partial [Rhodopirellula bahusiensis]